MNIKRDVQAENRDSSDGDDDGNDGGKPFLSIS